MLSFVELVFPAPTDTAQREHTMLGSRKPARSWLRSYIDASPAAIVTVKPDP